MRDKIELRIRELEEIIKELKLILENEKKSEPSTGR